MSTKKIRQSALALALIGTLALTANTSLADGTVSASTASSPGAAVGPEIAEIFAKNKNVSQEFVFDNLNVQFRYVDTVLVGIRFLNTGNKVIQINVFNSNYVLAPADYVVINPPKVRKLFVYQGLYEKTTSAFDTMFPNRFMEEHYFTLPLKQDDINTN